MPAPRFNFTGLTLLLVLLMAAAVRGADSARFAVLFGTPDCPECQVLKDWWAAGQPDRTAGVSLVVVDVQKPRNYDLLAKLEKACGVTPGDEPFPALYIPPQTLVYNYAKFAPLLPELVENARRCAAPPPLVAELARAAASAGNNLVAYDVPRQTGAPPALPALAEKPRQLAYFFLPRCAQCSRLNAALAHLEQGMPGLRIARHDITQPDGLAIFECVRARFGIVGAARTNVPMIVWENGWHGARLPDENPWTTLRRWFGAGGAKPPPLLLLLPENLVRQLAPSDTPPFWECFSDADKRTALARTRGFLDRLDWAGILLAGLIDGINPCAFATVIFLVAYLLYLGRSRKAVFLLGGSFCCGVFATYFLLGLGLSALADWMAGIAWLKATVCLLMGAGGLLLAGLHLRDAWRFHRGGLARGMVLGLSAETTRQIHAHVREYTSHRSLLLAGLLLGVIVSSLELVCTGQIYLPTLMVINRTGMTGRSLLLLLLYNAAFIAPLVAVTILAAEGVSAKKLAEFARRNVMRAKLLMAALFLLLAAILFMLAFS